MEVSVVIPLLDEEGSLEELHGQLSEVLTGLEYEIIYVNDGSRDRSAGILSQLAEGDDRVGIVTFRRNRGKSAALAAGFYRSRGEILLTIDADLQDDPFEIPRLIEKLNDGYDLVSGWKRNRKDPISKTIPSKFFNWVTAKFSGIPIHDFNCGLKAYRRVVVEHIKIYGQMHRFLPVLAKMEGFSIGEVRVKHHPRRFGRTKFGANRFLYGFLDLLTVMFTTRYTRRPLHLFGTMGIVFLLIGTLINAYLTIGWFMGNPIGNRPLFFLGILLIILGVQMFSIGLLGEMITRQGETEAARGTFIAPRI